MTLKNFFFLKDLQICESAGAEPQMCRSQIVCRTSGCILNNYMFFSLGQENIQVFFGFFLYK